MGCCGGGIDWGRAVNSWNETAGWLQALPRGKMLARGWEHWDALVGAFQGKSSHEQPFGARGMACGSGDLLFWGYQCPETLHRMCPPATLGFELALGFKASSSSPWLGQGTWVYVNRAEPESSCFQKASSKPSTSPSPSCSTNLGGERRLPG